eukprot:s1250_g8.t1
MINEHECATVAITYWHDDWKRDEWSFIVDKPFAFTRQQLAAQGHETLLLATWGKSLRKDRQPTTAQHATSVQIHATLPKEKLRDLLIISGWNRMWVTPKCQAGRLDSSWRIIWIDGNWAHLNSQASKTTTCAGLVRSKSSFGLRFATADYDNAWKTLFPEKPVPVAHDTSNLYQVQSLPYGCTAEMLTQWSAAIGWSFKALKALGPTSWLLGCSDKPPAEFLTFNGRPVLIKHIPAKDSTQVNPIIAGPLPSTANKIQAPAEGIGGPLGFDPWARAAHNKGLPPVLNKDMPGPSETKFQDQDAKIEAQNHRLELMEQTIDKLRQDTKHEFELVQQREKQAHIQVHTAIQNVKQDLQQAFQQAIGQQSQQLNGTLQELRSLLQTKPKRSREAEEEEMSD